MCSLSGSIKIIIILKLYSIIIFLQIPVLTVKLFKKHYTHSSTGVVVLLDRLRSNYILQPLPIFYF